MLLTQYYSQRLTFAQLQYNVILKGSDCIENKLGGQVLQNYTFGGKNCQPPVYIKKLKCHLHKDLQEIIRSTPQRKVKFIRTS